MVRLSAPHSVTRISETVESEFAECRISPLAHSAPMIEPRKAASSADMMDRLAGQASRSSG